MVDCSPPASREQRCPAVLHDRVVFGVNCHISRNELGSLRNSRDACRISVRNSEQPTTYEYGCANGIGRSTQQELSSGGGDFAVPTSIASMVHGDQEFHSISRETVVSEAQETV